MTAVAIDRAIVDHIAALARLELSEEEREALTRDLAGILQHCARLNELSTDDVEPTSHVIAMHNVFRDDVVGTPLPREAVLAAAPDHEDGFIKVPPVLEPESAP